MSNTQRKMVTIDGNEAAGYVAHKINEVCAIYPITPSSAMGEWADEFSAKGQKNIWGTVPTIAEMQSEAGAAGAVHGALQAGSLTTTFTASQGLLLMIPNMFKIAGELTSTVFHVTARSIATHALSIFGDHSDVMSVRQTGWGMMTSASVQEVMDFALISQAATLESRIPIIHFFDGFRTSHEVQKVEQLTMEDMRAMINDDLVSAHRQRALSPDHPVIRGTAQNPDVFFQAREACNPFYNNATKIFQKAMDEFAKITGRQYHLFDYAGAPDADRIIVVMGSGAETVEETVDYLNKSGEKVGVVKVRVYRPFDVDAFLKVIPSSVTHISVLDRTKEPGATGEPLYNDVITALFENGKMPKVTGGRYGLSSKEFTPAMAKGVFDNMKAPAPKNHFTIGINDDVSNTSLSFDPDFVTEDPDVVRATFWGLGSDGTVGANKNSIKIIGTETDNYAQGYFVYDSKKAGSVTVSHLRFGKNPIRSAYLVNAANFIGCHQTVFLEKYDVLKDAIKGAIFLLNTPYSKDEIWPQLPVSMQQQIIEKELRFYVIDAYKVARESKMGTRINTIMQTCFFAISGVLPKDEAIAKIKEAIKKTYGLKGDEIVQMNYAAVDATLANLYQVATHTTVEGSVERGPAVSNEAPEFVKNVLGPMIAYRGDELPVSAMPVDGTFPTGTTQWEKRSIALDIPVWDSEVCIQCGKCSLVCPHQAIRMNVYPEAALKGAPQTFKSANARGKEYAGMQATIQVAPEDCTGCGQCITACPAKNKKVPGLKAINLSPQEPLRASERDNFNFFLQLPALDRTTLKINSIKGSQLLPTLFEFGGNCAGCGETPYVSLMTQLFGDRAYIANATGCSSIYGGNLPTTPYRKDPQGRGPTWSNSLFEDCAEFGLGFRLTVDQQTKHAREMIAELKADIGEDLVNGLLSADQSSEEGIKLQRERVVALKNKLRSMDTNRAKNLMGVADMLVKKSVWAFGGDGWAFDIGYGGLDHVLASGRNINVLVMDTGVYSNTGGQCSKATPLGAVAKFAFGGKPSARKDLGFMAMTYGNVYVAQVAMGYNDAQVVKAFVEAESYDGPSIIIAYSHCIAQGITMSTGLNNQKAAVECGAYPVYRYDPRRSDQGLNPFQLDSKAPTIKVEEWAYSENRFKMLTKSKPEEAKRLLADLQATTDSRWSFYEQTAKMEPNTKAE